MEKQTLTEKDQKMLKQYKEMCFNLSSYVFGKQEAKRQTSSLQVIK